MISLYVIELPTSLTCRSSRFIEVVCILLSHLNIVNTLTLPTDICTMVDDILENLYPPHPDDLTLSLQLLSTVKAIIIVCPSSLLLSLLQAIQRGLCLWIEDRDQVVPEREYNNAVRVTFVVHFLFSHSMTCR